MSKQVFNAISGQFDIVFDESTDIITDITNFNNILSSSDTTVQAALETIDDMAIGDISDVVITSVVDNDLLQFNSSGSTWDNITQSSFVSNITPGSDTQVIFNSSGTLGASADLTFDGSTLAVGGNQAITGDADAIQLLVKGHSTQTNDLFQLQNSAAAERFAVSNIGAVTHANAYTFPTADGSANQVLETDGGGNLSFVTPTAAGSSGAAGEVQFSGGGGAFDSNTKFFWDDVNDRLGINKAIPTGRLHASNQAIAGIGGNDASTVLLINCDGANGGTTFTDSSTGGASLTVNVTGNANTSTAQMQFGTAAYLGDGTTDNINVADDAVFTFTDAFTVDFWVRFISITGNQAFCWKRGATGPDQTFIMDRNGGSLRFILHDTDQTQFFSSVSWTPATDTWFHLAFELHNGTMTHYRDGVSVLTRAFNGTGLVKDSSVNMYFASQQDSGASLNGYMDEIRVSNIARYQANFTPEAAPYDLAGPASDFLFETDGTLSVTKVAYETLVIDDNDIPNRKFVLDNSGGISPPGSSTNDAIVRWDGIAANAVQNSSVTITDTGRIRAVDGTQALPTYSFANDPDSGLFRTGLNRMVLASGGLIALDFRNDLGNPQVGIGRVPLAEFHLQSTGATRFRLDTVDAQPNSRNFGFRQASVVNGDFAFFQSAVKGGDPFDIGGGAFRFFYVGFTGEISMGGGIGTAGLTVQIDGELGTDDGTAASPSHTFFNDLDTGMFSVGADSIGLATNGAVALTINTDGDVTLNKSAGQFLAPAGTAAAPSYAFSGNLDTGMFVRNPALGIVTFVSQGTEVFNMRGTGVLEMTSATANSFRNSDGTAALPSYTFNQDITTGVFKASLGVLGISAAGAERLRVTASGVDVTSGTLDVGGTTISDSSGNISSANGANFGPSAVTSITVVNGIVTAIS